MITNEPYIIYWPTLADNSSMMRTSDATYFNDYCYALGKQALGAQPDGSVKAWQLPDGRCFIKFGIHAQYRISAAAYEILDSRFTKFQGAQAFDAAATVNRILSNFLWL